MTVLITGGGMTSSARPGGGGLQLWRSRRYCNGPQTEHTEWRRRRRNRNNAGLQQCDAMQCTLREREREKKKRDRLEWPTAVPRPSFEVH